MRRWAAAPMQRAISEGDASGDAATAGAVARPVDGVMSVNLSESGDGRAGRRSLWTAPGQTRPGQALPLVMPPSPRAAMYARIREPARPAGLRTAARKRRRDCRRRDGRTA